MKVNFRELLERLGVGYEMEGYQTQPWQTNNEDKGIFCSAEVRIMDGECEEVEAEIMFERENTKPNEPRIEILMWLQAMRAKSGQYTIIKCRFQGEDYVNARANWEEKICKFFKACVREIKLSKIPDVDEIIKETMEGDAWRGSGKGGGGGRSPKIKPNQLLNDMKKGSVGF